MYNTNLLRIVTMNPPVYNEYILIKKKEIDKLALKFIWKYQESRRAKTILRKNKVKWLTPYNCKICSKYSKETWWSWIKIYIDQWN
jgi:hypothetical protein